MLKRKISKPIQNISNRKLSIQFSLDGFSFCVSNFEDTIFHFSSYQFELTQPTPEELLKHIQEIFHNDKDLQDDFSSVIVIHQNNLNTFVPNAYFKEDALKSYLTYNVKTISTDFIASDDIDVLNIKNVYVPYVNINNFLFQNFGEFEYKHHASVLVEKLINRSQKEGMEYYCNVAENTIDLVVLNHGQLHYYNCFEYSTKEDFIYYILFTFEQLKLDPTTTELQLMGAIDKTSDLYEIAYTYIKEISFAEGTSLLSKDEEMHDHANFILLG